MSDDKTKRGHADRIRVNTSQMFERQHWQKAFGITKARLIEAVRAVGPMVSDVKIFLINKIKEAK